MKNRSSLKSARRAAVVSERIEPRLLLSTYVVNTTSDTTTLNTGLVTLRDAINAANIHPGPDTIVFNSSVFIRGSLHTIKLSNGQLSISDKTGATTIAAPGAAVVAVDANGKSRVFHIAAQASASISGITIGNGLVIAAGANNQHAQGGGILNEGKLTLIGSVVSSNRAIGTPNFPYQSTYSYDASGGGIASTGTLVIAGSVIKGNTARGANSGKAIGGGLFASGPLTVTGSSVTGNAALGGDGSGSISQAGIGSGGGIYAASSLKLDSSTVSGNTAVGGNSGPLATPRYFYSFAASADGGGITAAGTTTITSSTVSGNTAMGGQGPNGVSGDTSSNTYNSTPGGAAFGGGLHTQGTTVITASTFSGNRSLGGRGGNGTGNAAGSVGGASSGGAINGPVTLTNSTVANNSAIGGPRGSLSSGSSATGKGGGIFGITQLFDSTISGNLSRGGDSTVGTGGGIELAGAGTGILKNSIISGNKIGFSFNDIAGMAGASSAFNLIGVGGGLTNNVNGNRVGVTNPMLSALGDNGGPTQTMLPLAGSPAIDAGKNSLVPSGVTTDQRGFKRFAGKSVDIGATEYASILAGNSSISGNIFNDLNANGARNTGEGNLANFTVYIDRNKVGHFVADDDPTAITDANGNYTFANIAAAVYNVAAITPTGWRQTSPPSGYYTVPLVASAHQPNINFSFTQKIRLFGYVFNDANGNGTFDKPSEKGLKNWRVYIDKNNDGQWQSSEMFVLSDSNGFWSFDTLSAGTYVVSVVQQNGWTLTTPPGKSYTYMVGPGGIRSTGLFGEKM